jgi:hypothetical protein
MAILDSPTKGAYRLRARNGHGWQYRVLPWPPAGDPELVQRDPDFTPLTEMGVAIPSLSFIKGDALELQYNDHLAEVRGAIYARSIRKERVLHG